MVHSAVRKGRDQTTHPLSDRPARQFSGEPKYEPEARAEVAISYLLHLWAKDQGRTVRPLSTDELFEHAAGVTDFGTGPGLVSHQTPAAWAGAVTKPGFVKFAWQPGHDDWLFKLSGSTPMFLPTTSLKATRRQVRTYRRSRDGFDGSATMLQVGSGYAAFTTLPTGAVVYATSGVAAGEGRLEIHNLTMPGVPGLAGARTYRFAEGSATVASVDSRPATPAARVDEVTFTRTEVAGADLALRNRTPNSTGRTAHRPLPGPFVRSAGRAGRGCSAVCRACRWWAGSRPAGGQPWVVGRTTISLMSTSAG